MLHIARTIYDFMEEHLGVYDNPHKVEFAMMAGDTYLTLACPWPGDNKAATEDITIGLAYDCEHPKEFVATFGITGIEQLDAITPATLLKLYQTGKAEIYSAIDANIIYYPLYFRKRHGRLWATNDCDDEHEVTEVLETPDQFRDYTRRQFLWEEG